MIFSKLYNRALVEGAIMNKNFPQFKLHLFSDGINFEGWYSTTTYDKYHLKLILPKHYPDQIPKLYVLYPKILRMYKSNISINDLEHSHEYHTLGKDSQGNVQICHFSSETWHAARTCIGVMLKGQFWCESHAEHLRTGESIHEILINWKRSKEKWDQKMKDWIKLLRT